MDRFSTEGAEFESRVHGFIAVSASTIRDGIQGLATTIACQHGHPLFNPQKRNKKEAEIMIDALIVSRLQTTARTDPGLFVECLGFRLNACNQKHVNVACGDWLILLMILYE
jgi:streptomycin 6-kinase